MSRVLYYDTEGHPISRDEWAALWTECRAGGRTEVGDATVSTVYLGLDHSFGDGPPLIFETMVFGGPLHGECYRYATAEEARGGHTATVAEVIAAQPYAAMLTDPKRSRLHRLLAWLIGGAS